MIGSALILAAAALLMQSEPVPAPDSRVQQLSYEPDQVVTLVVSPGYAAVVELAGDEVVESVVVGDSAVWQVTPNSSGNRIVVKPLADAAPTNMIVLTDIRRYVFLLTPGGGQDLFVLRFSYPASSSPAATASVATYRFAGARKLYPSGMRDDGTRTIISWAEQTELPAVFAVGEGGKEAIVNGRMVGKDYVVEGISPQFVFRLGDNRAVARRKIRKAKR